MTPTTPPGKAPKKARRKVTTDLGRQLLTRERQRLSREQAALAEQQLQEAERRRTQQKRNTVSAKPIDVAISRSIIRRFSGVLASEGLSVRVIATPSAKTSAWTDFEKIVLNYAQQDDERILAATLRALAYHEGGHCRFTLPFLDLAEAAGIIDPDRSLHRAWNSLEDQRMETAVVSDSPRKAAYLTPMIMLDFVPTVNHAAANWPLLIWRRYLPKHIRKGARAMFVTKHNLMGLDGEALAKAMEACTTKYVLADNAVTMWKAVVEYQALLAQCAPLMANIDDAGHTRQRKRQLPQNLDDFLIIPVAGGDEGGEGDEEEGEEQTEVQTEEEFRHFMDILVHVLNGGQLVRVIYASTEGESGEGEGQPGEPSDSKGESTEDAKSDDDDEAGDEAGNDDDEAGEGAGEGGDDEGKEFANDDNGDAPKGGSTGEHKNTGVRDDLDYKPEEEALTDEALQEAIEEATAERDADPSLDGDVQSMHEALNTRTSDLMPYNAGISTDLEAKAAADNLAQDIERAFQESTVEKAPGWAEGQRRGFVNVLRYETRRPGDVEFFRAWTDTDAPGRNIAVSVLLDYSGSMGGATKELAQVGYACKAACQSLDIPCTVTLWDTNAVVLFDAAERAEELPVVVANGGTDPSIALADLDKQRFDKDVHLVLIMTDGAWSGSSAQGGFLASYKGDAAGRYFIGLGFSTYDGSAESIAGNLRRYGCDESHSIPNLMDIPRHLEDALIAFA